ncbi:MAG TPA: cytidylate kinase family protein, partial [Lacipirellulaceae bacterium]|nr:cytidylate kinase family protein [Lacipirellulaceae bacterium]
RRRGLTVRFIAPLKQRIQLIREKRQCTEREAEAFIEATDRGREQFVQRYFHHDITNPHLYDLVLNLGHMPREDAVDLIVSEAKRHEERVLAQQSCPVRARH